MQTVIKNVIMTSAMVNNKLLYSFTNANTPIEVPDGKVDKTAKNLSNKKTN